MAEVTSAGIEEVKTSAFTDARGRHAFHAGDYASAGHSEHAVRRFSAAFSFYRTAREQEAEDVRLNAGQHLGAPSMTSIGIVVVTFNSAQVLTACLNSIPMPRNLVVVDNASRDDSVAIAQISGAQILRNKRNLGFGAACNLGAALLTAPYVLFLNPDAVMADNAISELQKAIELYPAAGGFAPAVKIIGSTRSFRKNSYVQDQGSRYIADAEAPANYSEVDFIDGAACLYNRDLFLNMGGFDESLFLYFEDDDLSYRMRQSEKKLIYVPQALILHKKKASSDRSIHLVYKRSWHETASRLRLNKKYDIHCDINMERKRARIRLMRALITLNPYKALRYLGTLRAL